MRENYKKKGGMLRKYVGMTVQEDITMKQKQQMRFKGRTRLREYDLIKRPEENI